MRKVFISLLLSITLVGCNNTKEYERLNPQGIEEISYETLVENLESDVSFLLYIGRPDCGDCQEFYPYLEDYVNKNNVGVYYLNIKSFRDSSKKEDATQEEKDFYDNLGEQLDFDWVPTIHEVENGQFKSTYQYLDMDYYEIKDREKQKERKQEFLNEFDEFMDKYFGDK